MTHNACIITTITIISAMDKEYLKIILRKNRYCGINVYDNNKLLKLIQEFPDYAETDICIQYGVIDLPIGSREKQNSFIGKIYENYDLILKYEIMAIDYAKNIICY
eukprot:443993_1